MNLLGPHIGSQHPGVTLGWILTIGVAIYAALGFLGYIAINAVLRSRKRRATQHK
ncbi:MAG: hypothetical protein ACYCXG_10365 [Acidiferrobacter sp.]